MGKEKIKLKDQSVLKLETSLNQKKMTIVNIDIEKMKRKILFEIYYNNMISKDTPESIKKVLNSLLEYHYQDVYGSQYETIYESIDREEYHCLMYLNENN